MRKILTLSVIMLFSITLTSCKKDEAVFIEIDGVSYAVEDVIDSDVQLLHNVSDEDNIGDFVIFPLYDGLTCYAKSSKVYNSYYFYYNEELYTIIEAIEAELITSDFFSDFEEFDCVAHEYVIDDIIYDEVYSTETATLLVVRCRSEVGTDDIVDIGDVLNVHLYFSSGTHYLEYKVQYMDELYSVESALLLQIIDLNDVLNAQLPDLYYIEINCNEAEGDEYEYQPCSSGTTNNLFLVQDENLYRVTGSFDEYVVMKNIREMAYTTADLRTFIEGDTVCSAGSSSEVSQYLFLYEEEYYGFQSFLELEVVSLETIMENGGSPCMIIVNNPDE